MTTTTINAAAPEEGGNNGGGQSASHSPKSQPSMADYTQQNAAGLSAPTGHYGEGRQYGRIRYAVSSVAAPVNEGAKVKMELSTKNNNQLIPYIQNHIEMMTGNAIFPTPSPLPVDFQEQFNQYESAALAAINAEATWRDAIALRDQMRYDMVAMMNVRGAYVQVASNGNRQAITSSGLGVRNPPTYVTALAAPTNLRVDLNGEAGMMKVRWDAAPNAMTYMVQCSPDVSPRVWETLSSTTKTQVTKTLEVGVSYVFRAAANGVPGISNWSPEVIRGAA